VSHRHTFRPLIRGDHLRRAQQLLRCVLVVHPGSSHD
jgi:hypothetical protein